MKRLLVLLAGLVLAVSIASSAGANPLPGGRAYGPAHFASLRPDKPAAPVEIQLEAWEGANRVFLCDFTQGSNCGSHSITRGSTENLRYEVSGTDQNITCTSTPWNFSWWPNGSYDYTANQAQVTWTVDCSGDVGGATKVLSLDSPEPPSPLLTDIYGDNGETRTGEWSGGSPGNEWTVHQYANRYVVWTAGRGTYVIGRALYPGTVIPGPGHENNYMGPGYIGQFSPKEVLPAHTMVVNDALFVNDSAGIPPETPRDGVHGGLGCFAVDFYREGAQGSNAGLVDLNCRRLSTNGSPGVFDISTDIVTPDSQGVSILMTTRFRDRTSANAVFSVTYDHRFTTADVRTTYTWQSETNDIAYIKEPRIVAVFGTSAVPIYNGQGKWRGHPPPGQTTCPSPVNDGTIGSGAGVWGLDPGLVRRLPSDPDYKYHHWDMADVVPWCQTVTVGPGAVDPGRRYHRAGFSFDVVGVRRDLLYDDAGNHDYDAVGTPLSENFNAWRRNSDGALGPTGFLSPCPGGDVSDLVAQTICPPCPCPPGHDFAIGPKQLICETCSANAWEVARVPNEAKYAQYGQQGVFVAMESWRASISLWNFLERSRRLPALGVYYSQSFRF